MEIFLYSPGLYINISVLKPEPKQYTVHTFSRPNVCHGTSPEGSLEGCSSGDDLDQLPGDDGLSGSVESDPQFVDHLTWNHLELKNQINHLKKLLPAFFEELSIAVILELCSEVAPSLRA